MSNARKEKLGWTFVMAGLAILASGLLFDVPWGAAGALPFCGGFWWLFKTTHLVSVPPVSTATSFAIAPEPEVVGVPQSPPAPPPVQQQEKAAVVAEGNPKPEEPCLSEEETTSHYDYGDPNRETWLYKVVASEAAYYTFFFPVIRLWRESPSVFVGGVVMCTLFLLLGYAGIYSNPADLDQQPHMKIIEKVILGLLATSVVWALAMLARNGPRYWRRLRRRLRPVPINDDWSDHSAA